MSAKQLCLLFAGAVLAASTSTASFGQDRPMATGSGKACEIATAHGAEWMAESAVSLRVLRRNSDATDEMQKLMDSRSWKPGVAVGEQMTPEEANRFGNLQQQMKSGLLAMLMESKRERDIRILGRMAEIAQEASNPGYAPPQSAEGEDHMLALILLGSRDKLRATSREISNYAPNKICDFESSLAREAALNIAEIDRIYGINEALRDLESLTSKYGNPIDAGKMSPDDVRTRDRLYPVLQMALAKETLAGDLYFISQLEQVSKLLLESRRAALYEAPGDADKLGLVWAEWVKTGKVTSRQNELTSILNYLNEKIPPEIIKDMEALPNAQEQ